MATIKVACPKCGQKVSGDETFYGTKVECPVCSSDILFPGQRREEKKPSVIEPVPPEPSAGESLSLPASPSGNTLPAATFEESAVPQTAQAAPSTAPEKPDRPEEEEEEEADLPPSPIYGAISIVSAVLSVVICLLGGAIFAPIAIIFGHTALAKARHSPVQPAPGHTLGAIGLMIGYVSLAITIIVLLLSIPFADEIREAFGKLSE